MSFDLYNSLVDIKEKIKTEPKGTFSQTAVFHLKQFRLERETSEAEIYELALNQDLPTQVYSKEGFGEFNVTVFNDSGFNIQLYVMNSIPTEIHDHYFSGAFKVLRGKNLHTSFDFSKERELSEQVVLGNMRILDSRVLSFNDVTEINEGLIHQIFRIEKKNITLLAAKNISSDNAWYLYPRMKIANKPLEPNFFRKIQALKYWSRIDSQAFERHFKEFLLGSSLSEVIYVLCRMGGSGFTFMGEFEKDLKHKMYSLGKEILKEKGLLKPFEEYEEYLKQRYIKLRRLDQLTR